jgi:hypothetical protein
MIDETYMLPAGFKPFIQTDYREYIAEISKFPNRNAEPGSVAIDILRHFLSNDVISAYQIFKNLKSKGRPMAYKNVNKRVQKLRSLNLIKEVKMQSEHGAIYYRLTTGGIFNLLYKYKFRSVMWLYKDEFFQNYGDNIIFKTLVYPYFDRETILKSYDYISIFELFSYLIRCCEITDNALTSLKTGEPVKKFLFEWNSIPGDGEDFLLISMQSVFGFTWAIKENVKIEKFENDNAIKVLSTDNSLFIRLEDKKNKAVMTTNDGRTFELIVRTHEHGQATVYFPYKSAEEGVLENIANQISLTVPILAFSIITKSTFNKDQAKILLKDKKFYSLLVYTKKEFLNHYNAFVKAAKSK